MAGRPKLSDEEKARRAKEREAAKLAGIVSRIPVTATRTRRSPLEMLKDASIDFYKLISGSPLAATDFDLSDLEALNQAYASIGAVQTIVGDVLGHLEPVISRLRREDELQIENEAKAVRIAELEAMLADAQEQLRVTGNGERVPPFQLTRGKKLAAKKGEAASSEPANAA